MESTTRVVVYARSDALGADPVRRCRDRLSRLARRGPVDDVAFEVWPRSVERVNDRVPETVAPVDRFRTWADSAGVELGRAFVTQPYESTITGVSGSVLRLPVVGAAVYRDGRLVSVFPCETGDDHYAPLDLVETLDAGVEPGPDWPFPVTATDPGELVHPAF